MQALHIYELGWRHNEQIGAPFTTMDYVNHSMDK